MVRGRNLELTVPKTPPPSVVRSGDSGKGKGEESFAVQDDIEGWAGGVVSDMLVVSRFLGGGAAYSIASSRKEQAEKKHPPLQDLPFVRLRRPFVMIPGWTTRIERFQVLGDKLTQGGRNGGQVIFVKNGSFYYDRACTKLRPENTVSSQNMVFEVLLENIHEPPDISAVEIAKDLEAVKRVTGASKVDVDAYSMGGLGTRLYLDKGGDAIGKLLLLGTPNRGTPFADVAKRVVRHDIRFAMSIAGITVADLPALEWLSVDDGKGINNPKLTELNRHWQRQVSKLEDVEAIGGTGTLTLGDGWWPFTEGDGLVTLSGVAPPGGKVKILGGDKHHRYLNSDPEVYQEMIKFFGWEPES